MISPEPGTLEAKIKPNRSARAVFFAILVFEIVFIMAARTPLDSDLWWHLATGEQTLRNGWPALADTYSYTRAGAAWTNHSWLGEVVLALAYRAGGWIGISGLVAGLAAGGMLLIYGVMAGHPIWRAFLVVLASLVAAPVWTPRPQIFSLFLLALLIYLMQRAWANERVQFYWLPLIFALWSNLHGGYVLGFIFLACWAAGAALDSLLHREAVRKKRLVELAIWSGVSILAVLINPNGINMWRIPFQTVGVGILQQAIPEWASPDFHDRVQQPFLILLAGLAAALGLAGRPAQSGGLVSAVVFAVMALTARRNFGPFALAALPVLSAAGWQALDRLRSAPGALARLWPAQDTPRTTREGMRGLDTVILVVLALGCLAKLYVAAQPAVVRQFAAEMYPVEAAAWVRENQPPGRLFNDYSWGGFLIRELPDYPVFVDGRTDLFGDEIIGEWLKVMAADDGWQLVLDHWGVRLVMIPPGQALEGALLDAGWHALYEDNVAVVYGR